MRRFFISLGILPALLIPTSAFALNLKVYCGLLPGCHVGPDGSATFLDFLKPALIEIFLHLPDYIVALSGIFVIIGGLYMILHLGNDERYETGKKAVMAALGGLAIGMFSDNLVTYVIGEQYYDVTPSTLFGGEDTVLGIIFATRRIVFTFFNLILISAVIFNAMRMVLSRGNEEQYHKAVAGFFYGAIGAIIINIADRLVNAVLGFPL